MNRSRVPRVNILTFTGTRQGMTAAQAASVVRMLNEYRPEVLCNGCAIGADQQVLKMLVQMRLPIRIECWPSSVEQRDAARTILKEYKQQPVAYHPIFKPAARNTMMVNIPADLVLATPAGTTEEATGGTWDTIRKAAKLKVRITIVWPSGAVHAGYKLGRRQ